MSEGDGTASVCPLDFICCCIVECEKGIAVEALLWATVRLVPTLQEQMYATDSLLCQLNMLHHKAEAIKYRELNNHLWVLVINTLIRERTKKCWQASTVEWTECGLYTFHDGSSGLSSLAPGAWIIQDMMLIYLWTCYPKSQRFHVWRISNSCAGLSYR